jgi:hypothetical protein
MAGPAVSGGVEMVGQKVGVVLQPVGKQRLQRFCHASVVLAAAFDQDRVISRFLRQGMAELEFQFGLAGGLLDQVSPLEDLQLPVELNCGVDDLL